MADKMSTDQYSKLVPGMRRQKVHYAFKTKKKLPGVVCIEEIAGRLILHVDKNKLKNIA